VRAAEPLGYDEKLWRQLADMGAASMGLPEQADGDGAALVDLLLVAEEAGGALASVPFIEQWPRRGLWPRPCTAGPGEDALEGPKAFGEKAQAGMEDAVGLAVRVRGSRPDNAGLVGQDHGLDPVAEPELGQQVPDV